MLISWSEFSLFWVLIPKWNSLNYSKIHQQISRLSHMNTSLSHLFLSKCLKSHSYQFPFALQQKPKMPIIFHQNQSMKGKIFFSIFNKRILLSSSLQFHSKRKLFDAILWFKRNFIIHQKWFPTVGCIWSCFARKPEQSKNCNNNLSILSLLFYFFFLFIFFFLFLKQEIWVDLLG